MGSTAVPGLMAKPIIDMILVTPDEHADVKKDLEFLGYRYKGEYNVPLRSLYDKKNPEIYLHVHHKGNPEIELNLGFRDYMRTHQHLQKEYANLKKTLVQDPIHAHRMSTGVTQYNLGKNDFITRILKSIAFQGMCPRWCTQEVEWQRYQSLTGIEHCEKNAMVVYQGTDIVGAVHITVHQDFGFLNVMNFQPESIQHIPFALGFIRRWLNTQNVTTVIAKNIMITLASMMQSSGFQPLPHKNHDWLRDV